MLLHPNSFGHHQLPTGYHHGNNRYDYDDHKNYDYQDFDDDDQDNYDNHHHDHDNHDDHTHDNDVDFDVQENMYQSGASGAVSFTRPSAVLVMMIMTMMIMMVMMIMTISIIMMAINSMHFIIVCIVHAW